MSKAKPLVFMVGCGLVVAGVGLISFPAALIVGGLSLAAFSLIDPED